MLGIDFGERAIGVAVSCPDRRTALGLETIRRESPEAFKPAIARLREIIKEYGVSGIALGYPINLNGAESESGKKVLQFKKKLEANFKSIPVVLWDERLSTSAVARAFGSEKRNDLRRYKDNVDEMAAAYILQGYLDKLAKENEMPDYDEDSVITLTDDEGNEKDFFVLSHKRKNGALYLLAEEAVTDEDEEAEVVHLKCVSPDGEDDEMVFELITEDNDDAAIAYALFEDEYDTFEIESENLE